jgi:hypothetical protein
MKSHRVFLFALISCLLMPSTQLIAAEIGFTDSLIVSQPVQTGSETNVTIYAYNDEDLAGLDVPLRFGSIGDPIDLLRVVFADEVSGWDVTAVSIDNTAKTVKLGLIADLGRPNSFGALPACTGYLTALATLVFAKPAGYTVSIDTFSTSLPERRLMFVHNDRAGERPVVEVIDPVFVSDAQIAAKEGGSALPTEYDLSLNYPNPFNPSTSFTLSLPEASDYRITIYNITGQVVRSFSGRLEAGWHPITWDGTNDQGNRVASGAYLLNAQAGAFTKTIKMMLMK